MPFSLQITYEILVLVPTLCLKQLIRQLKGHNYFNDTNTDNVCIVGLDEEK